jgi:hypothetical protein
LDKVTKQGVKNLERTTNPEEIATKNAKTNEKRTNRKDVLPTIEE